MGHLPKSLAPMRWAEQWPSKYIHILSLEPVNFTLLGKRKFANVIKDLEMGDYPGLSKWALDTHNYLCKRCRRLRGRQKEKW